jgi:hypothetical protein
MVLMVLMSLRLGEGGFDLTGRFSWDLRLSLELATSSGHVWISPAMFAHTMIQHSSARRLLSFAYLLLEERAIIQVI